MTRKILIVEDDASTAAYLAKGLGEGGYAIETCRDGRDGLFLASEGIFDLVIADRMLPAEAALWDFTAGLQRTKLAGVLVTSGLADALGGGARDAREVARELGLSEDVTLRVLGAAAASRLVRLDRSGSVRLGAADLSGLSSTRVAQQGPSRRLHRP